MLGTSIVSSLRAEGRQTRGSSQGVLMLGTSIVSSLRAEGWQNNRGSSQGVPMDGVSIVQVGAASFESEIYWI